MGKRQALGLIPLPLIPLPLSSPCKKLDESQKNGVRKISAFYIFDPIFLTCSFSLASRSCSILCLCRNFSHRALFHCLEY
jgi:hypothetical protein